MATINEALKKLFLGLGGDPDELKDNNTVSDYIDDLESAIEAAASGASEELIDDEEASSTKTYSSSMIESLIPENELPTPAAADIGKVVSVISDGDEGAEYALETPAGGGLPEIENKDKGSVLTVNEDKTVGWKKVQTFAATVSGSEGGSWSVNLASGISRSDMVAQVQKNTGAYSAQIIYSFNDYGQLGGYICSNSHTYDNGVVFSGVLKKMGSETYYQVIVNIGSTAAADKVYLIPLTTT